MFGAPRKIISDGGKEFAGAFTTLCNEWGIEHACTLPYHQQANGLVERYMQSLNKILRIVTAERNMSWRYALQLHAFAYNASFHGAIANTPYFLNFGRDPHVPVDNMLRRDDANDISSGRLRDFARMRARDAADSITWTTQRLLESKHLMEHYYNMSQRKADYHVGDIVFLREEGILPKSAMRWSEPYRVQALDKEGLELIVRAVYGKSTPQKVPIQRVRPYHPSTLHPLSRQLAPTLEDASPPLVEIVSDLDCRDPPIESNSCEEELESVCFSDNGESGSATLPGGHVETLTPIEMQSGSRNTEDELTRLSLDVIASETPILASEVDVVPSTSSDQLVRNCQESETLVETSVPEPPQPTPSSLEEGETTTTNNCVVPVAANNRVETEGASTEVLPSVVGTPSISVDDQRADRHIDTLEFSPERQTLTEGEDSNHEFTIDRIRRRRFRNGEYEYLIRWEGFGRDHDSWEPKSAFNGDLSDQFDLRFTPSTRRQTRSRRSS